MLKKVDDIVKLSIESFFKLKKNIPSDNAIFKDNIFSEKEFELLLTLKNKNSSLLDDEIYFEFYLQTIDITFSYLYDIM